MQFCRYKIFSLSNGVCVNHETEDFVKNMLQSNSVLVRIVCICENASQPNTYSILLLEIILLFLFCVEIRLLEITDPLAILKAIYHFICSIFVAVYHF